MADFDRNEILRLQQLFYDLGRTQSAINEAMGNLFDTLRKDSSDYGKEVKKNKDRIKDSSDAYKRNTDEILRGSTINNKNNKTIVDSINSLNKLKQVYREQESNLKNHSIEISKLSSVLGTSTNVLNDIIKNNATILNKAGQEFFDHTKNLKDGLSDVLNNLYNLPNIGEKYNEQIKKFIDENDNFVDSLSRNNNKLNDEIKSSGVTLLEQAKNLGIFSNEAIKAFEDLLNAKNNRILKPTDLTALFQTTEIEKYNKEFQDNIKDAADSIKVLTNAYKKNIKDISESSIGDTEKNQKLSDALAEYQTNVLGSLNAFFEKPLEVSGDVFKPLSDDRTKLISALTELHNIVPTLKTIQTSGTPADNTNIIESLDSIDEKIKSLQTVGDQDLNKLVDFLNVQVNAIRTIAGNYGETSDGLKNQDDIVEFFNKITNNSTEYNKAINNVNSSLENENIIANDIINTLRLLNIDGDAHTKKILDALTELEKHKDDENISKSLTSLINAINKIGLNQLSAELAKRGNISDDAFKQYDELYAGLNKISPGISSTFDEFKKNLERLEYPSPDPELFEDFKGYELTIPKSELTFHDIDTSEIRDSIETVLNNVSQPIADISTVVNDVINTVNSLSNATVGMSEVFKDFERSDSIENYVKYQQKVQQEFLNANKVYINSIKSVAEHYGESLVKSIKTDQWGQEIQDKIESFADSFQNEMLKQGSTFTQPLTEVFKIVEETLKESGNTINASNAHIVKAFLDVAKEANLSSTGLNKLKDNLKTFEKTKQDIKVDPKFTKYSKDFEDAISTLNKTTDSHINTLSNSIQKIIDNNGKIDESTYMYAKHIADNAKQLKALGLSKIVKDVQDNLKDFSSKLTSTFTSSDINIIKDMANTIFNDLTQSANNLSDNFNANGKKVSEANVDLFLEQLSKFEEIGTLSEPLKDVKQKLIDVKLGNIEEFSVDFIQDLHKHAKNLQNEIDTYSSNIANGGKSALSSFQKLTTIVSQYDKTGKILSNLNKNNTQTVENLKKDSKVAEIIRRKGFESDNEYKKALQAQNNAQIQLLDELFKTGGEITNANKESIEKFIELSEKVGDTSAIIDVFKNKINEFEVNKALGKDTFIEQDLLENVLNNSIKNQEALHTDGLKKQYEHAKKQNNIFNIISQNLGKQHGTFGKFASSLLASQESLSEKLKTEGLSAIDKELIQKTHNQEIISLFRAELIPALKNLYKESKDYLTTEYTMGKDYVAEDRIASLKLALPEKDYMKMMHDSTMTWQRTEGGQAGLTQWLEDNKDAFSEVFGTNREVLYKMMMTFNEIESFYSINRDNQKQFLENIEKAASMGLTKEASVEMLSNIMRSNEIQQVMFKLNNKERAAKLNEIQNLINMGTALGATKETVQEFAKNVAAAGENLKPEEAISDLGKTLQSFTLLDTEAKMAGVDLEKDYGITTEDQQRFANLQLLDANQRTEEENKFYDEMLIRQGKAHRDIVNKLDQDIRDTTDQDLKYRKSVEKKAIEAQYQESISGLSSGRSEATKSADKLAMETLDAEKNLIEAERKKNESDADVRARLANENRIGSESDLEVMERLVADRVKQDHESFGGMLGEWIIKFDDILSAYSDSLIGVVGSTLGGFLMSYLAKLGLEKIGISIPSIISGFSSLGTIIPTVSGWFTTLGTTLTGALGSLGTIIPKVSGIFGPLATGASVLLKAFTVHPIGRIFSLLTIAGTALYELWKRFTGSSDEESTETAEVEGISKPYSNTAEPVPEYKQPSNVSVDEALAISKSYAEIINAINTSASSITSNTETNTKNILDALNTINSSILALENFKYIQPENPENVKPEYNENYDYINNMVQQFAEKFNTPENTENSTIINDLLEAYRKTYADILNGLSSAVKYNPIVQGSEMVMNNAQNLLNAFLKSHTTIFNALNDSEDSQLSDTVNTIKESVINNSKYNNPVINQPLNPKPSETFIEPPKNENKSIADIITNADIKNVLDEINGKLSDLSMIKIIIEKLINNPDGINVKDPNVVKLLKTFSEEYFKLKDIKPSDAIKDGKPAVVDPTKH